MMITNQHSQIASSSVMIDLIISISSSLTVRTAFRCGWSGVGNHVDDKWKFERKKLHLFRAGLLASW